MTRHGMVRVDMLEQRVDLTADIHARRAAVGETASGREVDGIGQFAFS